MIKYCAVTDCAKTFWKSNDNIYILSDVATTYQQAEKTCKSYGGEVAQIDHRDRDHLWPRLKRKYIPG